jgi:Flp pilus assembly protein TadG
MRQGPHGLFRHPEVIMAFRFPACSQALRDRAARALRKSKAFRNDEGGSIAILGAFVLVLLIMFVGVAYDYSKATSFDTAYQGAADAGALYVAKATEEIRNAGNTPRAADFQAGLEAFVRANVGPEEQSSITTTTLDIASNAITVEVCGTSTNAFGAIIGSAASNPCAKAIVNFSVGTPVAADIHILIDTSDSMGLAATDAARIALKSETLAAYNRGDISVHDLNCSFACHIKRAAMSTLEVARAAIPQILLRLDVAKSGVRLILSEIQNSGEDIQVSIWGFNNTIERIDNIQPVTASTNAALSSITIGSPLRTSSDNSPQNLAETTPDKNSAGNNAFVQFIRNRSAANPGRKQYILLVTDGVRATVSGTPGYIGPSGRPENRVFDQDVCDEFKSVAKLATMYLEYLNEAGDTVWDAKVGPIFPNIEPNMMACATSSSFFAKGDAPQEIINGLAELFDNIRASAMPLALAR